MHFIAVFEIFGSQALRDEISKELRQQFQGFSWVRPLDETYIVEIRSPEDRDEIRQKLVAIAKARKANNQRVRMLIGPAIEGGGYGGFLPKDMWAKINTKTSEPSA